MAAYDFGQAEGVKLEMSDSETEVSSPRGHREQSGGGTPHRCMRGFFYS